MKLYLTPLEYTKDNGIGQVMEAQKRYLPDYGIELVTDPKEAELKAAHIWSTEPDNQVLHCHGLHWTGDEPGYEEWYGLVNQQILESAKRAWAITVPTEWVAEPFRRDMRISPEVIGHGVTLADWRALPVASRQDYLLWNKNRADLVSSPEAANELARRGVPVVSTFGDAQVMKHVTGPISHDEMKGYLQSAGVYLSTAKETFGIGILEALACGVPVLAYAHGGVLDLVQHKKTGYLVSPGDVDGLEAGYKWLMANREEMQEAIAASVAGRDWKNIIGRYAKLYQEVLERKQRPRKVSVVITNYNYGEYIGGAIESVLRQTHPVEIIVVDDGSRDNSLNELQHYSEISNVRIIAQSNSGVAAARNNGITSATGEYIFCLDADDYLESTYCETLYQAMEADRSLGIAYTGLNIVPENGQPSPSAWPPQFDFELMAKPGIPPPNCIPCAAMFRRDLWERAGGYRQEYAPGEDTEFWLRGLSVGFNAKKVTNEPLFNYRIHSGSASRSKVYTDITGDKPWTTDRNLMPMAAPTSKPNLVRSFSEPLVSVIIPVGPGHAKHVSKALDSLLAQTFKAWEVIVVDDTENFDTTENLDPYPFVKHVLITPGGNGAGVARNMGIKEAKAPLLFFLDADDYLAEATALGKMVRAYTESGRTYVYSDWFTLNADGTKERQECQDYNQEGFRTKTQHAISVLVEAEAVRNVGGFNETLPTLEDWEFFIKLAAKGYCGVRVPEPLLVYNTASGTRRLLSSAPGSKVYQQIVDNWGGVEFMACSSCGGSAQVVNQANRVMSYPVASEPTPDGKTKMQYIGGNVGWATYFRKYEAGNDGVHDFIFADMDDVDKLLQTGKFALV